MELQPGAFTVTYVVEVVHDVAIDRIGYDHVATVVHCGHCGTRLDLSPGPGVLVEHARKHEPMDTDQGVTSTRS